jgi:hypothetical protein
MPAAYPPQQYEQYQPQQYQQNPQMPPIGQAPQYAGQPGIPGAVPPDVRKSAELTAKMAVVVAAANALLTVFLGVGATEAGKTNFLAMLLILLPTGALLWFGLQLLKAARSGHTDIDVIIKQRMLPVAAAAALIGFISGSGFIGLLPVVMAFFAVRTLQKADEAKKRQGIPG